ncbi:hypothetical protein GJ496_006322 [Pomphorhynchus laevis]|nr:hypothetical protein GJ496_006322 [Pomphorhynchus laevis]
MVYHMSSENNEIRNFEIHKFTNQIGTYGTRKNSTKLANASNETKLSVENESVTLKKLLRFPAFRFNSEQNTADTIIQRSPTDNLSNYEFIKKLGTGMIGRVYLVWHRTLCEFRAIKIMLKQTVIELHQIEHVKNERNILASGLNHPFIVSMFSTFNDDNFLYIVLEYLPGNELYHHIRAMKRFPVDTCRFYAMQVISAIGFLHSLSIIYRDLKPENVMLDKIGNVKLVDFGFSKKVLHSTWTLCGTPKYLAPEIILSKAYNKSVDWWTVGILSYEMIVGNTPFNDNNPMVVYKSILSDKIEWPDDFFRDADSAKDFIQKLLMRDPKRRLGNNRNGFADIKRHRWFKGISWESVLNKEYDPPIVPIQCTDSDIDSSTCKQSLCKWKSFILRNKQNPTQNGILLADNKEEYNDPFRDF